MAPRRLLGGWHRRRPTARPLTVGAAARRPCDFRWTAPPPNCLASSGGQRRCRPAALQPPADVVDTTRQPFDPPQRTPASLSLAAPVAPASALPAPCVSLLTRRTAPCQLRVKWRAVCSPRRLNMAMNRRRVFPERPRTGKRTLRGNISPLCIQITLIMARIDPHVFVLPCKMPLGNTSSEDLAAKGRYFRPEPPNHA